MQILGGHRRGPASISPLCLHSGNQGGLTQAFSYFEGVNFPQTKEAPELLDLRLLLVVPILTAWTGRTAAFLEWGSDAADSRPWPSWRLLRTLEFERSAGRYNCSGAEGDSEGVGGGPGGC